MDRNILSKTIKERKFKCDKCNKSYCTKKDLNDHNRKVHSGPKRCEKCGLVFKSLSALDSHKPSCKGQLNSDRKQLNQRVRPSSVIYKMSMDVQKLNEPLSRLVSDFRCIANIAEEGVVMYNSYILKLNPQLKIAAAAYESIRISDISGEAEPFQQKLIDTPFVRDWSYGGDQSTDIDYRNHNKNQKGSENLLERSHVAAWDNHRMNLDDCVSTMVYINSVPATKRFNRKVALLEEMGRDLVYRHGHILSITIVIAGDKVNARFMNGSVAIPKTVGKVFVYNENGQMHIIGMEATDNGTTYTCACEDPFDLIAKSDMPLPFVARRSQFATINHVINPDYNG